MSDRAPTGHEEELAFQVEMKMQREMGPYLAPGLELSQVDVQLRRHLGKRLRSGQRRSSIGLVRPWRVTSDAFGCKMRFV